MEEDSNARTRHMEEDSNARTRHMEEDSNARTRHMEEDLMSYSSQHSLLMRKGFFTNPILSVNFSNFCLLSALVNMYAI